MADIRWSLTASNDLRDIEDFIARDSVLHAVHFVDRLVDTVEELQLTPNLGRIVPEFRDPSLREILFRDYRIVYHTVENSLTILRVVHGARDLRRLVQREPWDFT